MFSVGGVIAGCVCLQREQRDFASPMRVPHGMLLWKMRYRRSWRRCAQNGKLL